MASSKAQQPQQAGAVSSSADTSSAGFFDLENGMVPDVISLLESFLQAFKEVRGGIIPFLTELEETLKRLEASLQDETLSEKKSAILQNIVDQYQRENRQAMNLLLQQGEKFFHEAYAKNIALAAAQERENRKLKDEALQHEQALAQCKEQAQQLIHELEQATQEIAASEQRCAALLAERQALKEKIAGFLKEREPIFGAATHYRTFLEKLVQADGETQDEPCASE